MLFLYLCFTYGIFNQNLGLCHSEYPIYLGGLFDIFNSGEDGTCNKSSLLRTSLLRTEMALFTIDKINRNEKFLPDVKLLFNPHEDCGIDSIALDKILQNFASCQIYSNSSGSNENRRVRGIIGPETSAVAVPIATFSGLVKLPLISFGATSVILSNQQRFSYFLRTVAPDNFQVQAMVKLLEKFNWTYVSFIYEDNEYGREAFDEFQNQINDTTICLAQQFKLPRDANKTFIEEIATNLLEETKAKVVVTFVLSKNLIKLFKTIHFLSPLNTRKLWVGSDAWQDIDIRNLSLYCDKTLTEIDLANVIDGAITFQPYTSSNKEFSNYIKNRTIQEAIDSNQIFKNYLRYIYNCVDEVQCANVTLEAIFDSEPLASKWEDSVANSVLAYANALQNAQRHLCPGENKTCKEFREMNGLLFRDYVRNVSFQTLNTNMTFKFDENNGIVRYDILRYTAGMFAWEQVGGFTEEKRLVINLANELENISSICSQPCLADEYAEISKDRKCCWNCRSCGANEIQLKNESMAGKRRPCMACNETNKPNNQTCVPLQEIFLSFDDTEAIVVTVASGVGVILTFVVGIIYVMYWNTPLIRASGRELSILILIGVCLSYILNFLFCVKPTAAVCGLRRLSLGLSYTLIFTSILLKSLRISLVFNTFGKQLNQEANLFLRPVPQVVIALCSLSVEAFIIFLWFLTIYPEPSTYYSPISNEDRFAYLNCMSIKYPYIIIGTVYPMVLTLICSALAIKIRKVPAGFNEAKYIGFAVYTTIVIWLVRFLTFFIELNSVLKVRDAIYCLCLALNSLIILLAIFAPKLYIVLMRPEKNNERTVFASQPSCSVASDLNIWKPSPGERSLDGRCVYCGQKRPLQFASTIKRKSLPAILSIRRQTSCSAVSDENDSRSFERTNGDVIKTTESFDNKQVNSSSSIRRRAS